MLFFAGLLVATAMLFLSVAHLNQPVTSYIDFVAFYMVIGGTLAVTIIIIPWKYYNEIIEGIKALLFNKPSINFQNLMKDCLEYIKRGGKSEGTLNISGWPLKILNEGEEFISLGMSKEVIETVLSHRIEQNYERFIKVATALRGLAKYPPAMGMVGTVFGLVNIMKAVSSGLDPKETGVLMGIALISTMYGLVVANLVILPAGELLIKHAGYQRKASEIAMYSVLEVIEKNSLLESQELLNSFVHPSDRINVISTQMWGNA